MTLAQLPSPPGGFGIVSEGVLRPGDLVWNPYASTWGGPTKADLETLGRTICFYYAVSRKTPSPRLS
ncbi:hypothetical protein IPC1147_29465 [Pseudomonas aeruginosa]|nr:hypothetical protein [Pseudomonas aeruginosa]MCO2541915.1 hypothetical protein [Pseudomonas aeruginosa]RQC70846.1 hypothetical protein IPC353_28570 [Pseudomonas aeruginosa]RRS17317.1 hypothetical protein IPC1107_30010 [Pseudomonas aeruginosa]RRS20029.1 hypothetical protein IPC1147_29465 [Pseudomonas aeruginosa]